MRKKIGVILFAAVLIQSCAFLLCACNGNRGDSLVLRTGTRPQNPSLITSDNAEIINTALSENATEEEKKSAVMTLFNVANYSRQNTDVSLMLQSSDAGIELGDVIMHGFNLKSGNSWYYQLATQATSTNAFMNTFIDGIAGLLKVAYTNGDGNYYYTLIKGSEPQCDCTVETFPYATFVVTRASVLYNQEQFKTELHYLESMHEINNMKFCTDIIADGAKITYNEQEHFYRVEFSVDMDADGDLLKEWFALPKEDMAVGGQTLESYEYYEAVLEVWDNGYAKSFRSSSSRKAGLGSGKPVDSFEYLWNENEILALLKEDEGISDNIHSQLDTIDDYIEYYSHPELVEAQLSKLAKIGIGIGSALGALLIGAIIAVIVVETLLKQGKLPKLAAKREAQKQKRLEKKANKAKGNATEPAVETPAEDIAEPIVEESTTEECATDESDSSEDDIL